MDGLKINLSSAYDTELLLKMIEEKKRKDEQKKEEKYTVLHDEYTMLMGKLEDLFIELDNLHKLLNAVGYIDKFDGHENYRSIKYHYHKNRGGYFYSHTRHVHFMRIEIEVSDWSVHFYNIEEDSTDKNKILEWRILLIKEFLEIYPLFIEKMNKKIHLMLK